MAGEPDVVFLNEYVRSFEIALEQRESKLFRAVRTATQAAKSKFYNFIGSTELE